MRPTIVLLIAGLTPEHIGADTPGLVGLAAGTARPLKTIFPAVTCSVQATFMTGTLPNAHGIVANGWLFRELLEIWLWRQSNRLVYGEKLWDAGKARDTAFTCANVCWWYNMGAQHDIGVTPRPIYKSDGRKLADCYTQPGELRDELTSELGPFPLFRFWGPATSIDSSRWIARAAIYIRRTRSPTLTLVYLPHLDYDLQRRGPKDPAISKALREIDAVAAELIADADRDGARVIVLSEYGIMPVTRPVHVNRALREAGLLKARFEDGGEILDIPQSRAFAVSDHQLAHVYVQDFRAVEECGRVLASLPGVDHVLHGDELRNWALDHPRSGEFVAVAKPDSWFTYYYWLDDRNAPDFARLVEIHRKPGYDPAELFIDPRITFPKLSVGWYLAKRALGFRSLLDIIPVDANLVRGSHGRLTDRSEDGPVFISSDPDLLTEDSVPATSVKDIILEHVFA